MPFNRIFCVSHNAQFQICVNIDETIPKILKTCEAETSRCELQTSMSQIRYGGGEKVISCITNS